MAVGTASATLVTSQVGTDVSARISTSVRKASPNAPMANVLIEMELGRVLATMASNQILFKETKNVLTSMSAILAETNVPMASVQMLSETISAYVKLDTNADQTENIATTLTSALSTMHASMASARTHLARIDAPATRVTNTILSKESVKISTSASTILAKAELALTPMVTSNANAASTKCLMLLVDAVLTSRMDNVSDRRIKTVENVLLIACFQIKCRDKTVAATLRNWTGLRHLDSTINATFAQLSELQTSTSSARDLKSQIATATSSSTRAEQTVNATMLMAVLSVSATKAMNFTLRELFVLTAQNATTSV